ncbi:MAG: NUDIX domain-containing protein [Acidimicrobiales bacterium]
MASPDDIGSLFETLQREIVWRGTRVSMERARFRGPDGDEFEREYTKHPGAVGVIALHDDGTVTLVRQFRGPMGRGVLEMPAGTCDVEGEEPEATARRELAEEVGLAAAHWECLAPWPVSPGVTDQVTRAYLATGLTEVPIDRVGPEERAMVVERVALHDVVTMAANGELIDAPTIAAVALAARALESRDR